MTNSNKVTLSNNPSKLKIVMHYIETSAKTFKKIYIQSSPENYCVIRKQKLEHQFISLYWWMIEDTNSGKCAGLYTPHVLFAVEYVVVIIKHVWIAELSLFS